MSRSPGGSGTPRILSEGGVNRDRNDGNGGDDGGVAGGAGGNHAIFTPTAKPGLTPRLVSELRDEADQKVGLHSVWLFTS